MTTSEQFVLSLPLKRVFYDRHEQRAYARAVEIAKRLVANPSLLSNGEQFLERHVRTDPHQRRYYLLWKPILALPAEDVAKSLLADTDQGAELRGSAPVFVIVENGAPQEENVAAE